MIPVNKHLLDVICLLSVEVTIEGIINFEDSDVFGIASWHEDMLLYKLVKLLLVSCLGLMVLRGLCSSE
jgi:hypothetical protein